jgi:hypothetical protein
MPPGTNTFTHFTTKLSMKKKIPKELILTTCLQKQEDLIKNYNERVTEMTADASIDDRSASQSEDRNAGNVEVLNTMEDELEFTQMEMGFLKSLDVTQVSIQVEPGAVVITNQRIFFIAVSSEKVEIDGEVIFGISTNAPIYSAMRGLKKGAQFEFNGIAYQIEDVY